VFLGGDAARRVPQNVFVMWVGRRVWAVLAVVSMYRCDRERRYPSDLTDAQWEIIEPMLPLPKWMGRPEKHPRRAVIDAILYVVRSGCAWRYLPADFPPWQTVYAHFNRFNERGVTERILDELHKQVRIAQGREPEPTAGIIDSQSVKGADTVGRGSGACQDF
jgi:transposase